MSAPLPPRDDLRSPAGSAAMKVSTSLGIVAAMVLAVLLNILVARHYKRWDWTRGGLFTLSDATVKTLRAMEEPVHVYVLLGTGDPLTVSLQHLLEAYKAETTRLEVEFTDPDRHPAEFLAVQQRFGITAGKTEDGRIVTDAAVVVARGDRPHFITLHDLVETEGDDELKRRPLLEQALTGALRGVMSTERPKACFTIGHGEGAIEQGAGAAAGGLQPFRESLTKSNFELADIGPAKSDAAGSLDGCQLLVVAGPTSRVPPEDVARYRAYVATGGSVLVASGPLLDAEAHRYVKRGLEGLLGDFGLKENDDFVFERDPAQRSPQGYGETFLPAPRPHAVTEGLIKAAGRGLGVILTVGNSLETTGAGAAAPVPLLVTSDVAFGMADFFAWAKDTPAPVATTADRKGPLTVAFASELPKKPGSVAPHGARMVLVGSSSVLFGANWKEDELRGTSIFIGSAVSWLVAHPVLLDVPSKPTFTAGLHVTDEWLASTFRYVALYIPLASVLLGIAVYLRRRGTERREAAPPGSTHTPEGPLP